MLTRAAHDAGCDGGLVLPPYFVKLSDDEIFAHYEALSKAVDGPVMLYNIPGNAVNALSPALVRRLADLDRIVGVKESSGDWNNYYATAIAVQDRLRVFCGPSSVFGVPAVQAGADGVIDCFPNMWAPGCLDLYYTARDGKIEEARRLQEIGVRLTTLFTTGGRTLYPATKAAMDMLGLPGGKLRPPLQAAHRRAAGRPAPRPDRTRFAHWVRSAVRVNQPFLPAQPALGRCRAAGGGVMGHVVAMTPPPS